MSDSVLELRDMSRQDDGDIYTYSKFIDAAYKFARRKLNSHDIVSRFLYEEDETENKLKFQLKSGHLEVVGKFYDTFVDASPSSPDKIAKTDDNRTVSDFGESEALSNQVLYSRKYQVVIVSIFLFRMPYYSTTLRVVFGHNHESISQFYNDINDNYRERYLDTVIILTDTSDGIEQKLIERDTQISFDQVVLDDKFKHEILNSINSFFDGKDEFYNKYNIPYRRGILLYGPPGNGKTTLVKSLLGMVKHPIVYWQVNEFTSSYSIRRVFKQVQASAPALLVIEDIDSIPNSCRSQFLNQLDGIQTNTGMYVIGTTNDPERVDGALKNRAGRFDRTYEVKMPTKRQRYTYLINKGLGKIVDDDQVELAAKLMDKFSMSMLNELYTLVAMADYYGETIDMNDIVERLKVTNDKQRKGDWSDDEKNSVGFIR